MKFIERTVADNLSVLSAQAYSPYGEPLMPAIPSGFGFTGEQTDPSNNLVYLRARHLDPRLGIFGSLDPFEGKQRRPGSLNRYGWVQGNVVNRVDPTGLYFASDGISQVATSTFTPTPTPGAPSNNQPPLGPTQPAPGSYPQIQPLPVATPHPKITSAWYARMLAERERYRQQEEVRRHIEFLRQQNERMRQIHLPTPDYGGIALAGVGLVGAAGLALMFAPAIVVLPIAGGIGAAGWNTIEQVEARRLMPENRTRSFLEIMPEIDGGQVIASSVYGAGTTALAVATGGTSLIGSGAGASSHICYWCSHRNKI